jgi:pimeloyl-ACP methyl ester carboxylesterase
MSATLISVTLDGCRFDMSALARDSGGELVFFIHGLGCAGESFAGAWDHPALSRYSLLAVDLPGFGASPAPEDFSCSLEDYAALCREIIRHVPHEKIHLAGHSMGGSIAVLLAGLIPGGPASLMNIEGNLIGADCATSRRTAAVSYESFRARLMRQLIIAARSSEERGMRLWAEWSAKSDPLAFTKSARSLVAWSDSGDLLRRFLALPCRRAYFYGERNRMMPALSRLGETPTVMVSRSGHFLMIDNPDEFYTKLATSISPPGSSSSAPISPPGPR